MRIAIVGTGYVGIVSAACLVRDGHDVTGIERLSSKVDDLNAGRTPIHEPLVADLLAAGHGNGSLHATVDPAVGLRDADMVWICVGTPSEPGGQIDLSSVTSAIREIGAYLRQTTDRPLVVVRSTVLPGTTRNQLVPELERTSGLTVGKDVHLVFHPEFLREGSAVDDFDNPPRIVVGEDYPHAGDRLWDIYSHSDAAKFRLRSDEAELLKYADNAFHAVKITFANELGTLAKAMNINGRHVADVFCADTKLNISPRYLRPGFAYGGSCLPKDLHALLRHSSMLSLDLPMLSAVPQSNAAHIERLMERLLIYHPDSVGMVGLAFKAQTDDLRESPYVKVAKRIIGEGIRLRIFDPGIVPDKLVGSNKQAALSNLSHLESLLVGSTRDLEHCQMIIVNHDILDVKQIANWLEQGKRVIDTIGVGQLDSTMHGYEGVAW